jgi:hypothetical protein
MSRTTNRVVALAAAVVAAVLLAPAAGAQESGEKAQRGLQGSWRVEVTLVDCASGTPAGPPFRSMLSFGDGTLLGTTLSAAYAPGQRSPDFGNWRATGGNRYVAMSEAFILYDTTAPPPAPQLQRGVQRLTQAITLGKNTFTSLATTDFFDVNGARVSSGCARAVGTRLK